MKDAVRNLVRYMINEPEFKSIIEDILEKSGLNNDIRLSSLRIDEKCRVYLTDYNNLEINIKGYQAKTLYIFYLLSPFGVSNADIEKYRDVLVDIYITVYDKNIPCTGRAEDVVNGLLNMEGGKKGRGLNDASNKIRSAFREIIREEKVFNYYIITGDRKCERRLRLPKELIIIENDRLLKIKKSAFIRH